MIFHIIGFFSIKLCFCRCFLNTSQKLDSDNAKQTKINGYQPDLLGPQITFADMITDFF